MTIIDRARSITVSQTYVSFILFGQGYFLTGDWDMSKRCQDYWKLL